MEGRTSTSDLARKYITDHNSPITKKLEVFCAKQHLSSLTTEEANRLERCLEEVADSLRHSRVERRLVRSVAEWIPDDKVAKITKNTSATAAFGVQNKFGRFLNAEEALFLLETNKLELFHESVSVSIEEAFKNIESLGRYQAYKQLWLQGYKLKRDSKHRGGSKTEEEADEPPRKVARLEGNSMGDVFESLRHSGPKSFNSDGGSEQRDGVLYTITGKGTPHNLIVESGIEFSSQGHGGNGNVVALSTDDAAYYRFYDADIPIL